MDKVKTSQAFVPVLSASSSSCAIKFDQHLRALLHGTRIEELDERMAV
jgi:hypothetical protein